MAIITELRSGPSKELVQLANPSVQESVISHLAGRLIQVTLAFYLLPALLVVLAVGGLGILILKIGNLFMGSIERSAG
jgi:hypothetical protein